MNTRRPVMGFTLIETMVAIVILLIFLSAIYGVFHAAQAGVERAEIQDDLDQTGRVLLGQLSSELISAYQASDATTSSLQGTDDPNSDTDPLKQQDQLTFLTTAHHTDTPSGGLCQVTYLMVGGTGGINNVDGTVDSPGLYLEEVSPPELTLEDSTPTHRLLSPLVVGFNCLYLTVDGTWETEWLDQTTLPRAVRIEITLLAPQPGAQPMVLETTVNPAMTTTPATGTGETDESLP